MSGLSKLLIAFGGNAILRAGQRGTYAEQLENICMSCEKVAELYRHGHQLVITHGNGPQVGNLLIQNEAASKAIPMQPLHSCVAQTQGQLGFMIQSQLENEFRCRGENVTATSIVTRVLVDPMDPAFKEGTKPIGPFFSQEHAKQRMAEGETWINDSNRGWRKVVPSPKPKAILDIVAIRHALELNGIVIAAGGGGIPVIERDNQLIGIEAVIDKDLASSLLARNLGIDAFIILTDVSHVKLNFGQPDESEISHMSADQAEMYLAEGQFGIGSMAPKVQAAIDFVRTSGKRAIIASLNDLTLAIRGEAGTTITV